MYARAPLSVHVSHDHVYNDVTTAGLFLRRNAGLTKYRITLWKYVYARVYRTTISLAISLYCVVSGQQQGDIFDSADHWHS